MQTHEGDVGWDPLEAGGSSKGWDPREAGGEEEGCDPLEAEPPTGKPSWTLAGQLTEDH